MTGKWQSRYLSLSHLFPEPILLPSTSYSFMSKRSKLLKLWVIQSDFYWDLIYVPYISLIWSVWSSGFDYIFCIAHYHHNLILEFSSLLKISYLLAVMPHFCFPPPALPGNHYLYSVSIGLLILNISHKWKHRAYFS